LVKFSAALHGLDKLGYYSQIINHSEDATMTTITDPVIGRWYKDFENNLTFKVVAIDSKDETIDVQYANGDLGEYDNDAWYASTFDYIEDPEDWSAPFDEMELDDLGYTDTDRHARADSEDLDISDFLD
jgi:hypothetical protein